MRTSSMDFITAISPWYSMLYATLALFQNVCCRMGLAIYRRNLLSILYHANFPQLDRIALWLASIALHGDIHFHLR